ncbi:MAG: transcriptional regulator [Verrucomicrobiales bacterium]|nr:transcriptional regulator [Verrucomicrobiales bacterium]
MRKAITQERLAEMTELNPRTIQKIEAGSINLLLTTIVRIRKALKCSWEMLLGKASS